MKTPEEIEIMRDKQSEKWMETKEIFYLVGYFWLNWVLREEKR